MPNKQRKSNKQKQRRQNSVVPRFDDSQSYAGQTRYRVELPSLSTVRSTTVTTGVIAFNFGVSAAEITGFASRFGNTFDEYRIVGARVLIRPCSASTGVSSMWFDEKSPSAPTANESNERFGDRLCNSNAMSKSFTQMRWSARDLLDLEFTDTGTTSVTPVTFKVYTDAANWGAPITVTPLWVLEMFITFEFKGLKST